MEDFPNYESEGYHIRWCFALYMYAQKRHT